MPALPVVPNVIKLTLNWGVDGNVQAMTVHHQKYTGTADGADLGDYILATVLNTLSEFQALCTSFTGVLSATARDLASDMGAEFTGGSPWVGTRTGDRLAPATAAVVSHSIARHYRGGQPRSYFPWGSATDVASTGLWSDAFVTAATSAWNAFVADQIGNTFGALNTGAFCNVSYYGPPNRIITGSTGRMRTVSTLRTTPIVNEFVSSAAKKVIASQRRRNRDA